MRNHFMMTLLIVAGLSWFGCNRQRTVGEARSADVQDPQVAQEENRQPAAPELKGPGPNLSQGQNFPSAEPQETAQLVAEGELSKVDAQRQTISIRKSDGTEMQFSFNKDTPVEGAGKTVEGLANWSEKKLLTIHYQVQGGANMASRIEVQDQAAQKQRSPSSESTEKQRSPSTDN